MNKYTYFYQSLLNLSPDGGVLHVRKVSSIYQYVVKNILYWELVFIAILLIFCISIQNTMAAERLGRLFTTPQERSTLEKLRHQKPVENIQPEVVFKKEPKEEEVQQPEIGGITVNGLVYRENGKSTAWVNNSNTYEGNLENQYIQIDTKNIDPDNVVIEIPSTDKEVKLKTGETYDPEAGQIHDFKYQKN